MLSNRDGEYGLKFLFVVTLTTQKPCFPGIDSSHFFVSLYLRIKMLSTLDVGTADDVQINCVRPCCCFFVFNRVCLDPEMDLLGGVG